MSKQTLGQQLAELSLKARNKKLKTKKAWSEHMKKVRAAALDKHAIPNRAAK
jgi:hypothetical protein